MKLSQVPEVIAAKKRLEEFEDSLPVDMSSWSDDQREEWEKVDAEYTLVRKKWRAKLGDGK